jgi:ATP-binding cassette subfamily B protein
MKFIIFIKEIFKKFPLLLMVNTVALIAVSLFGACSLFTISPVVDFIVHPDLKGVSPLTEKAVDILNFFGLKASLTNWLYIFIFFIILSAIFQIFARYLILKAKYAMLRDIVLGTFKDFFNAKWYFFSSGKQGVLLNTFGRELTVVSDAFAAIALLFASALQMFFFLAVPFYISWKVTVISLIISFLFALPFILLGKITYKLGMLRTSTSNDLTSVIQENISLAKIVLGFSRQQKSTENMLRVFDCHREVTIKSQMLELGIPILYRPFGLVMLIISLFVARLFNLPLSEMAVLLVALLQVAFSIGNLAAQKNSLENFFPSYEQTKSLRELAKSLEQKSGQKEFKGFDRQLFLDSVSFGYPGQKEIFSNLNIVIPKGKMVALVGESGVGKSTLIDLIMGFHEPQKGGLVFDGVNLKEYDIHSYRSKIGYVPQDSVLFNMSIRDNLLWAHESASDSDIIEACRQANAHEFIEEFPQGYNIIVGDRGIRLSGGQIQRIALARAILRKPCLLVLDEATSSLDTYSERLIQQAIENIAKETTVIVVAHRLSTIVNADYVYVLGEGNIIEEGTYAELIARKGHFNRMVRLQVLEATH